MLSIGSVVDRTSVPASKSHGICRLGHRYRSHSSRSQAQSDTRKALLEVRNSRLKTAGERVLALFDSSNLVWSPEWELEIATKRRLAY